MKLNIALTNVYSTVHMQSFCFFVLYNIISHDMKIFQKIFHFFLCLVTVSVRGKDVPKKTVNLKTSMHLILPN